MITYLRSTLLVAVVAGAFALTGCSASTTPAADSAGTPAAEASAPAGDDCTGVSVIVETGTLELDEDASVSACIATDEPILAADALAAAGVVTEGTDEYGDQVVCRVNGVPSAEQTLVAEDGTEYHEACESMPAAFAYWSMWQKPAGGEWGYAQEGLATLELAPGDSIELLFALNDATAAPSE